MATSPSTIKAPATFTTQIPAAGKPVDWMNELPNDVLFSILSLLSIKDAAKARVLSRRWRYIFPLHLNFDFHTVLGIDNTHCYSDISRKDICRFITAVDQFLELYNGQKLDSLTVFCGLGNNYASHIDGWIRSAIRMKIKRLDLDLSANRHNDLYDFPYDFPYQLLLQADASQLKHLHLTYCNLNLASHLVDGPISLTKLDLEFVPLDQNSVTSILSGCLNLEWLRLRNSKLPETFCIHGHSLRLKTFIVYNCRVNKFEISSVGLTTFDYTGKVKNFTFIDVDRLEKVHLCFIKAYNEGGTQ